jgi:hypothetical protein
MKTTATGLGLLLGGVLLCLACTGGQTPNAANSGNSANSGNLNSNADSERGLQAAKGTPTPDPCATPLDQRAGAVGAYLTAQIGAVPKLASQYPAKFDFRVTNPLGTQYLIVYVGGLVQASHGNGTNNLLKKFEDIIDPVMRDGCVMRVDMIALNQLTTAVTSKGPGPEAIGPPPIGFEVTSCEDPTHPCANGTCSESCATVVPTPTPGPGNTNTKPAPKKSPSP